MPRTRASEFLLRLAPELKTRWPTGAKYAEEDKTDSVAGSADAADLRAVGNDARQG